MISSQKGQGSDWSLYKQGNDSMANSLIGAKSEVDSLSQDTGVFSMPSSMISSNSMALSFAAEMDSSGFFSDMETGRNSCVPDSDQEPAKIHQISPITENSEPESNSSSNESQVDCHKSESVTKVSQQSNIPTTILDVDPVSGEIACLSQSSPSSLVSFSEEYHD